MLRSKNIDRICCLVIACTMLLAAGFTALAGAGVLESSRKTSLTYAKHLFDQSTVHKIEITMDGWDDFIDNCTDEKYRACAVTIDGEAQGTVGIRAKGNTSLSSMAQYDNDRYSFKIEFDHYQKKKTYRGLDKLSLNNIIQDATYMKDNWSYTFMNQMGLASPLCSHTEIYVNGEYWGLYLAVEGVEEAFLERNYGEDYGELYKPDSLSFGGGRGNGRGFNMDDVEFYGGEAQADPAEAAAAEQTASGQTRPEPPSDEDGTPPERPDGQQPGFSGEMPELPDGEMPAKLLSTYWGYADTDDYSFCLLTDAGNLYWYDWEKNAYDPPQEETLLVARDVVAAEPCSHTEAWFLSPECDNLLKFYDSEERVTAFRLSEKPVELTAVTSAYTDERLSEPHEVFVFGAEEGVPVVFVLEQGDTIRDYWGGE